MTCLDEEGTDSSIFTINRMTNEAMPIIRVNVTGIRYAEIDAEKPDIVWLATDSGPFFIDTRYPHCMWAIMPGGRWIEAMGIVDGMGCTLDVNQYAARFKRCAQDPEYRLKLETCDPRDKDIPAEICNDLFMAGYFNTKRYTLMAQGVRPEYLLTADDGQMLSIAQKMFTWTSMKDGTIIPGELGGLLCGALVTGGLVLYHENRKIIMVQAPWAERKTEYADYSEKVIARTEAGKENSMTRLSDLPNVDTKYLVARVTENMVFAIAADDGIYRFDVSDSPEEIPMAEPIILSEAPMGEIQAHIPVSEEVIDVDPRQMRGVDEAMLDGMINGVAPEEVLPVEEWDLIGAAPRSGAAPEEMAPIDAAADEMDHDDSTDEPTRTLSRAPNM